VSKVWFITGSSRGFGDKWAEAAPARGVQVAATARNTDTLKDLVDKYGDAVLPIALDVTDRAADFAAIDTARAQSVQVLSRIGRTFLSRPRATDSAPR
jgi:NADP-dependent 3-hydroxy acid dehydrogenase YdfG